MTWLWASQGVCDSKPRPSSLNTGRCRNGATLWLRVCRALTHRLPKPATDSVCSAAFTQIYINTKLYTHGVGGCSRHTNWCMPLALSKASHHSTGVGEILHTNTHKSQSVSHTRRQASLVTAHFYSPLSVSCEKRSFFRVLRQNYAKLECRHGTWPRCV